MKFCSNCGNQLDDNAVVCTKCGQGITAQLQTAVNPPTAENAAAQRPVSQLKTNRGLLKFILLSIVTLGIYSLVYYSSISTDINIIASRYDGKKTMHYCLLFFVITPLTLGVGTLVWFHKLSARIGAELARRALPYAHSFGAGTFWGWDVLGLLIGVGPFIYIYKLSKAMNQLAENYNRVG